MQVDIDHIGKLANVPLLPKEKKKFEKQLSSILDYFKKLSELKTEKVEETSQVTGLKNVLRFDQTKLSFTRDEALKNAKKKHNGMFVVPVVIEKAIE